MSKTWIVELQKDEQSGDAILEFPPEMLQETGWKEGDVLNWSDNGDGSLTLKKRECEWVLVDCISTYHIQYMVQVPLGKKEWALDDVVLGKCKEFSQKHISEDIITSRVIKEEDALEACSESNDYTSDWSDQRKKEVFFTEIGEDNGDN